MGTHLSVLCGFQKDVYVVMTMPIILSHRGYWLNPSEKNTITAFQRSFTLGFGTETDVRDLNGTLVIAHDMPRTGAILFTEFLSLYTTTCQAQGLAYTQVPLALNIKADGLQESLKQTLEAFKIPPEAYFLFDMSVPDALVSLRHALPCYTRMSEYEPQPLAFFDRACGVWLDAFHDIWYTPDTHILPLLQAGKQVCVVSPELHTRDPLPLWHALKECMRRLHTTPEFTSPPWLLCTDKPEEAQTFFIS